MKVDYLAKVFKEEILVLNNYSARGKGKTPKKEQSAPALLEQLNTLRKMFGDEVLDDYLDNMESEN